MRARVGTFLLCCLLIPSVASAAEGQGEFVVRGSVEASGGALFEGAPLAFFAADTGEATAFEVEVSQAKVQVFEQHHQAVAGVSFGATYREASWIVHDATIRLMAGDHSGFFGL